MQVIFISSNNATHKQWHLTLNSLLVFVGVFIVVLATIMMSIDSKANNTTILSQNLPTSSSANDVVTKEQYPELILEQYYVQRLGKLQAESIRLKALTEKIANMAGVDVDVFELNNNPAQGGYDLQGEPLSLADFKQELGVLEDSFKTQNESLDLLQNFYITKSGIQSGIPQGSPSEEGWISSKYGKRIDPFNGKKTFHHGLDIAGRSGSPILAVADGIITWTGKRSGYGQLVEIDHGNGYVTRYAHNKTLIAKLGERVSKGQPIALMGSTGRSTGPHVHFEVLLEGKSINPYSFVKG